MDKPSTKPVKGFRDFLPDDWCIQRYIFDTWRKVCESYGYEEYNGPVLENIQIYNKSGDDIGTSGKELYSFTDKKGRRLALRPEMTPTVGRLVAEYATSLPKPIRWFSIAQFFRAEKPQKGRSREFYQLNADIFGSESTISDLEIINLAIDIMLAFGADKSMFQIKLNNRKFTDYYFENILGLKSSDNRVKLIKIIDAYPKKGKEWLRSAVSELNSDTRLFDKVEKYLSLSITDLENYADESDGAKELVMLFDLLKGAEDTQGVLLDLSQYCIFDTSMARGFDYYTGMVFEVFDINPSNNRSIFGGGRYDDLLDMFDRPKIPAVGFAPGDVTTRLFLETWGLLYQVPSSATNKIYAPIMSNELVDDVLNIARSLRGQGRIVEMGLEEQNISKALTYANKRGISKVLIFGKEEKASQTYKIKDMKTGKEESVIMR